jgi:4-hydroxy-3-polyprenylbenzoate decarboxylase
VIALRETPLHGGHLRTMTQLSDIGAIVAPIVPAFYQRPKTLDDIIEHSVGRLLDLFGIDLGTVHRWKEPTDPEASGMRKGRGATEV